VQPKGSLSMTDLVLRYILRSLVGEPGQGPYFAELLLQLLPGIASVIAAIQFPKEAVGQDQVRVRRMGRKGPDWRVGLRRHGARLSGLASITEA